MFDPNRFPNQENIISNINALNESRKSESSNINPINEFRKSDSSNINPINECRKSVDNIPNSIYKEPIKKSISMRNPSHFYEEIDNNFYPFQHKNSNPNINITINIDSNIHTDNNDNVAFTSLGGVAYYGNQDYTNNFNNNYNINNINNDFNSNNNYFNNNYNNNMNNDINSYNSQNNRINERPMFNYYGRPMNSAAHNINININNM